MFSGIIAVPRPGDEGRRLVVGDLSAIFGWWLGFPSPVEVLVCCLLPSARFVVLCRPHQVFRRRRAAFRFALPLQSSVGLHLLVVYCFVDLGVSTLLF